MPSNIFSDHPLGTVTTPSTIFVVEALVVEVLVLVVVADVALVVLELVGTMVFRSWLAKRLSFLAGSRN